MSNMYRLRLTTGLEQAVLWGHISVDEARALAEFGPGPYSSQVNPISGVSMPFPYFWRKPPKLDYPGGGRAFWDTFYDIGFLTLRARYDELPLGAYRSNPEAYPEIDAIEDPLELMNAYVVLTNRIQAIGGFREEMAAQLGLELDDRQVRDHPSNFLRVACSDGCIRALRMDIAVEAGRVWDGAERWPYRKKSWFSRLTGR